MSNNTDYIVRATAANAQIRAFACTTRGIAETARTIHGSSPVVTAAHGRLLTAAAMMGIMMKGEKDLLTLRVQGNGLMRGMTVTANSAGNVKGYVVEPVVIVPPNEKGKLDVSAAVGRGTLSVIKDMGLKEPYVGQIELQTGEIADDLTYYFATSEQVPSSVGLGVLMERDNTVKQAGGFIIQLMPFAEDSVIDRLEQNLSKVDSVTKLLDSGKTPEEMLELLLEGLDLEIVDTVPTGYVCDCHKERVEKAIVSIGKKDIKEMIDDGKEIEVNCQFCGKNYIFTVEELEKMYKRALR